VVDPAPQPTGPVARLRGHRLTQPGSWTLRARLVALLLVLLFAVTGVVGTVTVLSLHSIMVGQLDSQLTSAADRTRMNAARTGDDAHPGDQGYAARPRGPGFLGAPGTAEGTLGAAVDGGVVVAAATIDRNGANAAIPLASVDPLAAIATTSGGGPRTVSIAGLGDYRVIVSQSSYGPVLVTGLPLHDVDVATANLAWTVVAVGGVLLVVAGVSGGVLARRTLRPLKQVADTASEVARTPLARGQVRLDVRVPAADPRTEVGQVSAAVNAMLGHVERALEVREASEQRVRGFVADASHELRTPLAAIRGYAELTRRGDEQVPPSVAHALGRVESEATRMTGLVEDLLLLARLDSGRPLDREPVDVGMLLVDALTDAQVAGPDHTWRLHLPDEPVEVEGDGARLHQVIANLLANARTHTPPGTTVTASVRGTAGHAVLSVADDGPGVPPAVLPTVFERFARGESSRSREHGSTGLGLAIVSSIVGAHDGTVDVESRPGFTVFRVRLPLRPDESTPVPAAADSTRAATRSSAVTDDAGLVDPVTSAQPVAGR
jgi:two-component system OmpR family sensor kinase